MPHDDDADPFLAEVARELRRPVHLDAHFDARVMAALDPRVLSITAHRATSRAERPWYRRTFSVSVSQVAGLAAAAALGGVVVMGALASRSAEPRSAVAAQPESVTLALQPVAQATADPEAVVQQQFIIIAPSATAVALVGDFTDWDASRLPMERVSPDGAWSITVPLRPGRYEYQFEVDGVRVTDPTRPQMSSDFGSANSVVTVEGRN